MADQFGSQRRQSIIPTFRPAILDCDVLTFEVADLAQTLAKRLENRCRLGWRPCAQPSDHWHRRLLRVRRERPCDDCTATKCDELASPHKAPLRPRMPSYHISEGRCCASQQIRVGDGRDGPSETHALQQKTLTQ